MFRLVCLPLSPPPVSHLTGGKCQSPHCLYRILLQNHTCRSAHSLSVSHTHSLTPLLQLQLPSLSLFLSLSSIHTCLLRTHQVHARRRVCTSDSLPTSLAFLPGFFFSIVLITFGHTVPFTCVFVSVSLPSLEFKHRESRDFFSFVHCCLPSTSNSVWHLVNTQSILVEHVEDFSSYSLSNITRSQGSGSMVQWNVVSLQVSSYPRKHHQSFSSRWLRAESNRARRALLQHCILPQFPCSFPFLLHKPQWS